MNLRIDEEISNTVFVAMQGHILKQIGFILKGESKTLIRCSVKFAS